MSSGGGMEFVCLDDGRVLALRGGTARVLTEGDRDVVVPLFEGIASRFPQAFDALSRLYNSSRLNWAHFQYKVVRRFVACNFGKADMQSEDIAADGSWNFERTDCPLRGECALEGVVCGAREDFGLSKREEEVLSLAVRGLSAKEMAEELCISPFMVKAHVRSIVAKLGGGGMKRVAAGFYSHAPRPMGGACVAQEEEGGVL